MNFDPKPVSEVIAKELDDIRIRRARDGRAEKPLDDNHLCWEEKCHKMKLFGLCLSGGGIRSATFGLGVLQGLAEKRLLQEVDYLSTVSGGGYIGSFLQGLLLRGTSGFQELTSWVPDSSFHHPVSFLRKYSNYLAPRVGLSLDAIVIPVIWLRNMLLNQAIIISAIAALFLLLSFPGALVRMASECHNYRFSQGMFWVAALCGLISAFVIGYGLNRIRQSEFDAEKDSPPLKSQQPTLAVGAWGVLPLVLGTVALLFALVSLEPNTSGSNAVGASNLANWSDKLGKALTDVHSARMVVLPVLTVLLGLIQYCGGFVDCFMKRRTKWLAYIHIVWMSLVTASFMWSMLLALSEFLATCRNTAEETAQYQIALAPPLYLVILMLGMMLHIGLMGRDLPDSAREWLARAGALTWVVVASWLGLFAVAIFSPFFVGKAWLSNGTALSSAVVTWITGTLVTVFAGKSAKTDGTDKPAAGKSVSLDTIARYGPFLAIPGFLIAIAFGVQALLRIDIANTQGPFLVKFVCGYWSRFPDSSLWRYPLLVLASAISIFVILSLRVDINEFSMHHFYKNRLVRCYLGASVATKREPDRFTGFDPHDDFPLSWLCADACLEKRGATPDGTKGIEAREPFSIPYPILNATLTVTEGSELATQERKALPWMFTPHYSGFIPPRNAANDESTLAKDGYACTSEMLGGGIHLGTAMGISGAALNPTSGFHSAPQTAFLLTLFDVRLGWWVGNPRNKSTYYRPGPLFSLWWLFRELLGFVDERSAYLNLSDGGNFENLGLYELIRRRCRFVIAVDAEEDPKYGFTSLGAAVRKCRTDFGVEIEIDPQPIAPKDGLNGAHCVVGRIRYPEHFSREDAGWLLYIKASITGDEPADVLEYRRRHTEFPQQSTIEQFFSESQFESYRRLGQHVIDSIMDRAICQPCGSTPQEATLKPMPQAPMDKAAAQGTRRDGIADELQGVFERLSVRWELPPLVPEGAAARHADAYSKLMHELTDPELEKLIPEIVENYPVTKPGYRLKRNAFLFYLDLLLLMETVFLDLNFSNALSWDHPANEGWRRIFKFWARQESLRAVWESQGKTYGAPFQNFFNTLIQDVSGLAAEGSASRPSGPL